MKRFSAFLCVVSFFLSACAHHGRSSSKGPASGETYTVTGEVLWKGEKPVVHPIPTTAYKSACGRRQAKWALKLKSTRLWHKRLLDVAVWLTPADPEVSKFSGKAEPQTVVIHQSECKFEPRMIVVPVGSQIEVVNDDKKDHWLVIEGQKKRREQYVQYYGETPSVFTFDTPGVHRAPVRQSLSFAADRPDIWRLRSGFHRWMEGWVIVTDKRWFDPEIGEDGIFEIRDVPPGTYTLHSWHPLLGEESRRIEVPGEGRGMVSVTYSEIPAHFEKVASTLVTTDGEVVEERNGGNSD